MTKEEMLKIVDKLIDNEKSAINDYNKAIEKLSKSPRLIEDFGHIYEDKTRHLRDLLEIRQVIESHDDYLAKQKLDKMFGAPVEMVNGYEGDGIFYDDKAEEA